LSCIGVHRREERGGGRYLSVRAVSVGVQRIDSNISLGGRVMIEGLGFNIRTQHWHGVRQRGCNQPNEHRADTAL
jgi:hypothetical protein